MHRRAVSAGFGTVMNGIVWEEARHQMEMLAEFWIEQEKGVVGVVREWTSTLALHVISSGFFGRRLEWGDYRSEVGGGVPEGHRLTLDKALSLMLGRLATVFMTPRVLLGRLPGRMFREASVGFEEVTRYFAELKRGASEDLEGLARKRNKTILGG